MLDQRIRVLTLSGELDLPTERRLRADLSEIAGDRSRELVIDLRGVTFIDSSGLAVLVHTQQQLERQGRALGCVVRGGPVERLLEDTGLANTLPVFDSLEAAADEVLRAAPEPADDPEPA